MFKTKAELIAYIDRHFEDSDELYVPSFYTKTDLRYNARSYIDELPEGCDKSDLTDTELNRWRDIFENDRSWEWLEETSSAILFDLVEERDN